MGKSKFCIKNETKIFGLEKYKLQLSVIMLYIMLTELNKYE